MTTKSNSTATRRAATLALIALLGVILVAALTPSADAATLANLDIASPNQRANSLATWYVEFTTVGAVPRGGDVRIVFPSFFTTSFGGASRCDILMPNLSTENTTVVDAQTVVCGLGPDTAITANTKVRLAINNVRNPPDPGTTGVFSVQTRNANDGVIDQHNTNTEEILAEQVDGLSKVDIRGAGQKTGTLEPWTFKFTTTKSVPHGGGVRIVFPTGFTLSTEPASGCQWNTPGVLGRNSTVTGDHEITCHLNTTEAIAGGSAVALNVTGVRNPTTEQYTEPFRIQTLDGTTVLDESTLDQELIAAHPFLAGPVHRQNTTSPGALATHRFEFILFNGWGGDGMFEIRLPPGHNYAPSGVGQPNLTFERGGTGTFAPQLLEGDVLQFRRVGGQPLFNGAHLLVRLDNITNPTDAGQGSGGITVATLNATGQAHDRGLVASGLIETTASPTTTTTTPANTTATSTTEATNDTAPTNTTATSPIGPLDDDPGTSRPAAGQGSPGLEAVPVLAALVVATLLAVRRRRA